MKQRTNVHVRDGINSVSIIDKVSRIFFPAVFTAFNVFYWITYLDFGENGNVLMWDVKLKDWNWSLSLEEKDR